MKLPTKNQLTFIVGVLLTAGFAYIMIFTAAILVAAFS